MAKDPGAATRLRGLGCGKGALISNEEISCREKGNRKRQQYLEIIDMLFLRLLHGSLAEIVQVALLIKPKAKVGAQGRVFVDCIVRRRSDACHVRVQQNYRG